MAASKTVDALIEAARENGATNPYAFACGVLGTLADEAEVQKMIDHLVRKA